MDHPTPNYGTAHPSGRSSVPVVRNFNVEIDGPERTRLVATADAILRTEPALCSTDYFGPTVTSGLTEAPAALLGDQREIHLLEDLPSQVLEHRIALLASDGDVLISEVGNQRFYDYLGGIIGCKHIVDIPLGRPVMKPIRPIGIRATETHDVMAHLAKKARTFGGFQVIPYFGAGSAWMLARTVAEEAGAPVTVAAPPPRLAQRINDKLWFTDLVRQVLGTGFAPPTLAAFGPAAVAAKLRRMANVHERVVVKIPDSAGSRGNIVVDSSEIRELCLADIRFLVLGLLRSRGWRGRFPVLVGAWEVDAYASPSVQVWIPLARGLPIVEGMFEQRLSGPESEFVGAVPARLSRELGEQLAEDALRLALTLQHLGYFGRCSFDALLVRTKNGPPSRHWIECNGRWGGASLPMTFANRVFGNHSDHGMVVIQDGSRRLSVRSFSEACNCLGPVLFTRERMKGAVPFAPSSFDRGVGLELIVLGDTQEAAMDLARRAVSLLAINDIVRGNRFEPASCRP